MSELLQIDAAAHAAFLRACTLDVAVRKPGNVSRQSPGHGMQAELFIRSAMAAAPHLLAPGTRVGERIAAAQAASWQAAGCNTNLGILLLCAPLAAAVERCWQPLSWPLLRQAIESVLAELDLGDARAAYRAIAAANPGGLGQADAQDVHDVPSVGLREAMALAAGRDSIARQYRDGFAELLALAKTGPGIARAPATDDAQDADARPVGPKTVQCVQHLYLTILARWPDSHIVRKHGEAVAHTVMRSAQAWRVRASAGEALDAEPSFAAWDARLKSEGINPGTTADLTVATLMLARLMGRSAARADGAGSS